MFYFLNNKLGMFLNLAQKNINHCISFSQIAGPNPSCKFRLIVFNFTTFYLLYAIICSGDIKISIDFYVIALMKPAKEKKIF